MSAATATIRSVKARYSAKFAFNIGGAAYWMPRWSLSSGSPKARPGGGA
jgi:hypothetical protein